MGGSLPQCIIVQKLLLFFDFKIISLIAFQFQACSKNALTPQKHFKTFKAEEDMDTVENENSLKRKRGNIEIPLVNPKTDHCENPHFTSFTSFCVV